MSTELAANALRVSRAIHAPRETVFNAWLDPDQICQWFKPDPSMVTTVHAHDARVGGAYRIVIHNPKEEKDHICTGEFQEITPPSRLVMTWRWERWRTDQDDSRVTIDFNERDGVTTVTVTHTGLPDASEAEDHTKGWTGCLESLSGSFNVH